jgi:hypothetical protein
MTTDELANITRQKKDTFLEARALCASHDELKRLADEYTAAVAAWHKERFPGKRFNRPSVGYLIRAL